MARRYSSTKTSIWDDDDFLALTANAQRTYWFLTSQKDLALTGVLVRRSKWARCAANLDAAQLDAALDELEAARFIVIDADTDEVWIRTHMRHDGVLGNPKLRTGARRRIDAIHSPTIRALVAAQLEEAERAAAPGPADDPSGSPSTAEPAPEALWTDQHASHDADHPPGQEGASDRSSHGVPDSPTPSSHLPSPSLPPSQSDPPPRQPLAADDERLIAAVWPIVAQHQLDAQRQRGQTINHPDRWLATALRRAIADLAPRARELVTTYEIPDPRTLADLLTGRLDLRNAYLTRRTPGAA